MDRKPVNSSSIRSVGYDATLRIMEIEFDSGGIYQYFDTPQHLYQEMMSATSKGKFFDSNIIKHHYRYRKIN